MDEETVSLTGDVDKAGNTPPLTQETSTGMNSDADQETGRRDLRPSIEVDDDGRVAQKQADNKRATSRASSRRHSGGCDEPIDAQPDNGDQSYVDHSEPHADDTPHKSDTAPREGEGDESSSQHEGTDEDVFTDKSPRSSMGSYDAGSESGKGVDIDNMTTITRSPRISDISQYDKEDFIPTARGTPRPPFRTPSDVRAMQMSSPTGSVLGSPRSSRKHFPTVSRLGTPTGSAQYSPKRKSTPPRFKTRQEAPLVLLHVTLLPLRWMWGDLVNNLDPVEMSEQAKTLRSSWRILQDRVGDTVIERGILLGHPQNDYEVLEERLLEALDLPVRRRARILECGHYLGPSNETTLTEDEESEDEHSQHRRQSATKRHWCGTCKSEIRYDALGEVKVFRVKVYASNGLMRAGAWEACWKEMERVDVELEPIVEPVVQDEIVRLAAAQQEREIAQQEEAEIAKEVALQYEEQRRSEEHLLLQEQARLQSFSPPAPEVIPEALREHARESRASRRHQQDEERLREIYGQTPPPPPPPKSHSPEPSSQRHPHESYTQAPTPRSPEQTTEKRGNQRRGYQSASLPELLLQSARVLMQDRKNVVIFTLSLFVLVLSLRSTPTEPPYEPIIHRLKNMQEVQQLSVVDSPPGGLEQHRLEARAMEPIVATPGFEVPNSKPSQAYPSYEETLPDYESSRNEQSQPNSDYQQAAPIIERSPVDVVAQGASQDAFTTPSGVSTIYEPCESPLSSSAFVDAEISSVAADAPLMPEPTQETVLETVEEIETTTEKKVVRVIQTVTKTQTQTETQTEVETATAVETVTVKATKAPQVETSPDVEEKTLESQDDAALVENELPNDKVSEDLPEADPEPTPESLPEAAAAPTVEPEIILADA